MLTYKMHGGVLVRDYHHNQVRARQMMKYCLPTAILQLVFLWPTPNSTVPSEIIECLYAFPTAFVQVFFLLITCIHMVLWQ